MLKIASWVPVFSPEAASSQSTSDQNKTHSLFYILKKKKPQPHGIQFCSLLVGQLEVVELDDGCVAVEKGMREELEKNEFLWLLPGDLGWQCKSGNIPGKDGPCIGLEHPFYPKSIRNYFFFLNKTKQNKTILCTVHKIKTSLHLKITQNKTQNKTKPKKKKQTPAPQTLTHHCML